MSDKWICDICGTEFDEYINGCPHCENAGLRSGVRQPASPPAQPSGETHFTTDDLLVLLMEECSEVIKAASKCIRFGYKREQPEYGQNDKVLSGEIGDLLGVIDALSLDHALIEYCRKRKIAKAAEAKVKYGK